MSKDMYSDYDSTASNNTDVGGVGIVGSVNTISNIDDAAQELMSHTADHFARNTIASAATTNLGGDAAHFLSVTGTTTITGLGTVKAGTLKFLHFAAALTLTHNATSLILPGAANITTVAGDTAVFVSEGSGNWRCLLYARADGRSIGLGTIASQDSDNVAITGGSITGTPLTIAETAQALSGAHVDFSIPSWAKAVDLYFEGASQSGTGTILAQLGDSGGVEGDGTGYLTATDINGTRTNPTAGFDLSGGNIGNTSVCHGILHLRSISASTWVGTACTGFSSSAAIVNTGGSKALDTALTTVRLAGTGTLDAGNARVVYW